MKQNDLSKKSETTVLNDMESTTSSEQNETPVKTKSEKKQKFLDLTLCHFCPISSCTTKFTFRDLFKMMLPVGWTAIAIMSVMAYVVTPLLHNEDPEWGRACVLTVSVYAGIGLCCAIYGFHRSSSTFSKKENYKEAGIENGSDGGLDLVTSTKMMMRRQSIKIHAILSTFFGAVSSGMVIFFCVFATDLNMCVHENCGTDVFWSAMALFVSVFWVIATYIGYLDWRNIPRPGKVVDNNRLSIQSSMSFGPPRSSFQSFKSSMGNSPRSSYQSSMSCYEEEEEVEEIDLESN